MKIIFLIVSLTNSQTNKISLYRQDISSLSASENHSLPLKLTKRNKIQSCNNNENCLNKRYFKMDRILNDLEIEESTPNTTVTQEAQLNSEETIEEPKKFIPLKIKETLEDRVVKDDASDLSLSLENRIKPTISKIKHGKPSLKLIKTKPNSNDQLLNINSL